MTPADDAVRQWCIEAADVLRDAALRAGHLSAALATDWLDDCGRGWSERVAALRRELADACHHADELTARLRDPDGRESELARAMAVAVRAASAASGGTGPRLGDTAGGRADDEHGVHIAQLPDDPG